MHQPEKAGSRRSIRNAILLGLTFMALAGLATACGRADGESAIRVAIADDAEARDGFAPGDPLRGGTIRLLDGDTLVVERPLGDDGRASFTPPPGSYTVQVFRESAEAGCFWGNTLYDVAMPQPVLQVVAFQVCSG